MLIVNRRGFGIALGRARVEADFFGEADRCDIDGQLFHCVPVRTAPVVVSGAFAHDEWNREIGIGGRTNDHHLRLAVAAQDVRVTACAAQRCRADGSCAFHVDLAHRQAFLTGTGRKLGPGNKSITDQGTLPFELRKVTLTAGLEPPTTRLTGEVTVICATGRTAKLHRGMVEKSRSEPF